MNVAWCKDGAGFWDCLKLACKKKQVQKMLDLNLQSQSIHNYQVMVNCQRVFRVSELSPMLRNQQDNEDCVLIQWVLQPPVPTRASSTRFQIDVASRSEVFSCPDLVANILYRLPFYSGAEFVQTCKLVASVSSFEDSSIRNLQEVRRLTVRGRTLDAISWTKAEIRAEREEVCPPPPPTPDITTAPHANR